MNPDSLIARLLAAPMKPGKVVWIGIRPARRAPLVSAISVDAIAGKGLRGDHYKTQTSGARQITLIQAEHLLAIASYLQIDGIQPDLVRRNIVVNGLNLLALKGKRFLVGDALCEYTGECHPCSRMEEALGTGGYNAVRGHGGITARILTDGTIKVGDDILQASTQALDG